MASKMDWKFISMGDLLRKEVSLKSKDGMRIESCFKQFKLGK